MVLTVRVLVVVGAEVVTGAAGEEEALETLTTGTEEEE